MQENDESSAMRCKLAPLTKKTKEPGIKKKPEKIFSAREEI